MALVPQRATEVSSEPAMPTTNIFSVHFNEKKIPGTSSRTNVETIVFPSLSNKFGANESAVWDNMVNRDSATPSVLALVRLSKLRSDEAAAFVNDETKESLEPSVDANKAVAESKLPAFDVSIPLSAMRILLYRTCKIRVKPAELVSLMLPSPVKKFAMKLGTPTILWVFQVVVLLFDL